MKLSVTLAGRGSSASLMHLEDEEVEAVKALPVKYGDKIQKSMKPMCWSTKF
jgi:hypothetical protein